MVGEVMLFPLIRKASWFRGILTYSMLFILSFFSYPYMLIICLKQNYNIISLNEEYKKNFN